ncbi:MAG: hypothetical protein ABIS47_06890 [Acidimicrobiales bacterium]
MYLVTPAAGGVRGLPAGAVRGRGRGSAWLLLILAEIRDDLAALAASGVTETFVDLNFDPEIGAPEADPQVSMRCAHDALEAFAPR